MASSGFQWLPVASSGFQWLPGVLLADRCGRICHALGVEYHWGHSPETAVDSIEARIGGSHWKSQRIVSEEDSIYMEFYGILICNHFLESPRIPS